MDVPAPSETYHWSECADCLMDLGERYALELEPDGRGFCAPELRIVLPGVFPVSQALRDSVRAPGSAQESAARRAHLSDTTGSRGRTVFEQYLEGLPDEPGLHCLILLQAGAVSLGIFDEGQALATKTLKRYVVRGKGRAQPAYLDSKGKSRYGSRLRLQNARLLFEETNEKLSEYWDEFGEPELIFANAPKRLWPDLFRAKVEPPFGPEHSIVRVPWDLPIPTTDTLVRTYKRLSYGRVEYP
jgi:hypothetical protein